MRILFESHIPPRYIEALEATSWAELRKTTATFHEEAEDTAIATYAAENGWVVFTRDSDFFHVCETHGGVYCIWISCVIQAPKEVVAAIESIRDTYENHSEIQESIPLDWV